MLGSKFGLAILQHSVLISLGFVAERWGWTWFKQDEDAWRKKYPYVTKKIDELEKRIKKLEK